MSSIVSFDDFNRNQINVAICGAVSAGKSTLLNAIFVASYSDMKIKRTTMNPQVYYETSKHNKKDSAKIKERNTAINQSLYNKDPKSLTMDDIKETCYIVPQIKNLAELDKNVFLSVYDIPGLNDSQTKHLYFQYLTENFYKFDVILFVVDIHSALNTSDESDILEKILQNSKENSEKYGIQKKLIIVANKCDELTVHQGKLKLQDEELEEMYEQIKTIVGQRVNTIYPEMEYHIVPLSSEDSYIYRMYDENPSYELDLKHINKFGCNEYGRSRWNRLKDSQKKQKIKELMGKMDIEETLLHTGFNGFGNLFKKYLNYRNQYTFLLNHLRYGLSKIVGYDKLDIDEEMQKFYLFFQRFGEINSSFLKHLGKATCSDKIFHEYLNKFMENYQKSIVEQYINFSNNTIKSDSHLPQVEKLKIQFDEYTAKFNTKSKQIEKIRYHITESLNNLYVSHIKGKQKGVSALISYLYKLFNQKFKITSDLVKDIFDNNDMKNKSSDAVIKHIKDLEKRKLVNSTQKKEILFGFLKTVYRSCLQNESIAIIENADRACYFHYADLFWTDFRIKYGDSHTEFNELTFLCKQNMHTYMCKPNQKFSEYSTEKLKLEIYIYSLCLDDLEEDTSSIPSEPKMSFLRRFTGNDSYSHRVQKKKKTNSEEVSQIDTECLSDDLDAELGLKPKVTVM
jgi:predicted GTPase